MALELVFLTDRPYNIDDDFRSRLGQSQPLTETASQSTPVPDRLTISVSPTEVRIRFEGVPHPDNGDTTKTSVDKWSSSVTSALPNAVETARNSVSEG